MSLNNAKKNNHNRRRITIILSEQFNEIYHSKNGAITESDYVYINKGLAHWLDQNKQDVAKSF